MLRAVAYVRRTMVLRATVLGAACALLLGTISLVAHDPITTRVTWNGDVARIVQARCVSCHRTGGRAPMPLTTYAEARPWAKAIKEEVMTRRMPKWHAARGYGDFANDPSLSPFEIALIMAWADGGAPLGEDLVAPASVEKRQETVDTAGRNTSVSTVPCRSGRVPSGLLTAVRPVLSKGGSIGLAVTLPDGRTEVLAWIRNFDPDFAETYGLRRPLAMPHGSRLVVVAERAGDDCSVMLTLVRPR